MLAMLDESLGRIWTTDRLLVLFGDDVFLDYSSESAILSYARRPFDS